MTDNRFHILILPNLPARYPNVSSVSSGCQRTCRTTRFRTISIKTSTFPFPDICACAAPRPIPRLFSSPDYLVSSFQRLFKEVQGWDVICGVRPSSSYMPPCWVLSEVTQKANLNMVKDFSSRLNYFSRSATFVVSSELHHLEESTNLLIHKRLSIILILSILLAFVIELYIR